MFTVVTLALLVPCVGVHFSLRRAFILILLLFF